MLRRVIERHTESVHHIEEPFVLRLRSSSLPRLERYFRKPGDSHRIVLDDDTSFRATLRGMALLLDDWPLDRAALTVNGAPADAPLAVKARDVVQFEGRGGATLMLIVEGDTAESVPRHRTTAAAAAMEAVEVHSLQADFLRSLRHLSDVMKETVAMIATASSHQVPPFVVPNVGTTTTSREDPAYVLNSLEWCQAVLIDVSKKLDPAKRRASVAVQVPMDAQHRLGTAFQEASRHDVAMEVLRTENAKLRQLAGDNLSPGAHAAEDLLEIAALKKRLQVSDVQLHVMSQEIWRRDRQIESLVATMSDDSLSLVREVDRERCRAVELERRLNQRQVYLAAANEAISKLEVTRTNSVSLCANIEQLGATGHAALADSVNVLLEYTHSLEHKVQSLSAERSQDTAELLRQENAQLREEIAALRVEGGVECVLALQEALAEKVCLSFCQ